MRQCTKKPLRRGTRRHRPTSGCCIRTDRVCQKTMRAYMWYSLAATHSPGDAQRFAANLRTLIARLMTPRKLPKRTSWRVSGSRKLHEHRPSKTQDHVHRRSDRLQHLGDRDCTEGAGGGAGAAEMSSTHTRMMHLSMLTGLWLPMTQQPETIARPNAAHGPKRLPLAVSVFGTAV